MVGQSVALCGVDTVCVAHGTQGGPLFISPCRHVQLRALQVTGLLFRPLVHDVRLHIVSCVDLPSGS